jgi:excisionase family DNA binding protein
MSEDTSNAFLTVRELAALLRISRKTAYLLVKTGEIPSVKVGGSYRIPRAELERQLAESATTNPAA